MKFDFKDDFVSQDNPDFEKIINYLPKYDPEGYRYIYFARETMSGENANKYRVEYGAYDSQTDTFVDTLLDGYVAGNVSDRLSDDTSIYNTGTVTNVLTDTTNVQVRKTWIADAFQSELGDVSVSFRLESRPENSDEEWATVPDVSFIMGKTADDGTGKPGVPFTAENMMQIHSTNLPVYDNEGNRLEYRWVEDKIHQGETEITVTDGKFMLSQKGENVEYTSTSTYDEENRLTDIVNEIVDMIQKMKMHNSVLIS